MAGATPAGTASVVICALPSSSIEAVNPSPAPDFAKAAAASVDAAADMARVQPSGAPKISAIAAATKTATTTHAHRAGGAA